VLPVRLKEPEPWGRGPECSEDGGRGPGWFMGLGLGGNAWDCRRCPLVFFPQPLVDADFVVGLDEAFHHIPGHESVARFGAGQPDLTDFLIVPVDRE
jgi:hypothetical protein